MRLNWIKFKVSTKDNFRCSNPSCRENIDGKKGFVKIQFTYNWTFVYVILCLKCFNNFVGEVNKDKKKSGKMYKDLVNKLLFRGLK